MSKIQSVKKFLKNPDVPHFQTDTLITLSVHLMVSFGHITSTTPP
jgi:hypothetical protein